MEETRKRHNLPFVIGVGLFIGLAILAIILFLRITSKTHLFHQLGEVSFSDEVPTKLQEQIREKLANVELQKDLQVSLSRSLQNNSSDLLYNIYVPVTDFYDARGSITEAELDATTLIPINELTNQQKLLAIDNEYYLDTLNSGAVFESISLSSENEQDINAARELIKPLLSSFPERETVLSFAQTGVTALSRGMNAKLNSVKDAKYFSAKIADYLSSFDLTHTSNESSFSSYANSNNICSDPDMINVLTTSGIDVIELTGNHNQDCGDEDAIATIDLYESLEMRTVGGGKDQVSGAVPLEINRKGNHITMLAYNLSTGGYTLDDTPGANYYTKEKASGDIAAAKERRDFIIVDIQYNECSMYVDTVENTTCDYANSAAGDQIGFFRELIDMGADLVVGTSAHQPQTFEIYHGKPIYYGLGNLFFDQYWWPGTTRSLVLEHYFYQNRLLQTRITPTVYDSEMQTELMNTEDTAKFIARLIQARPNDSEEVRK